jgi:hypothetical protein
MGKHTQQQQGQQGQQTQSQQPQPQTQINPDPDPNVIDTSYMEVDDQPNPNPNPKTVQWTQMGPGGQEIKLDIPVDALAGMFKAFQAQGQGMPNVGASSYQQAPPPPPPQQPYGDPLTDDERIKNLTSIDWSRLDPATAGSVLGLLKEAVNSGSITTDDLSRIVDDKTKLDKEYKKAAKKAEKAAKKAAKGPMPTWLKVTIIAGVVVVVLAAGGMTFFLIKKKMDEKAFNEANFEGGMAKLTTSFENYYFV